MILQVSKIAMDMLVTLFQRQVSENFTTIPSPVGLNLFFSGSPRVRTCAGEVGKRLPAGKVPAERSGKGVTIELKKKRIPNWFTFP